MIWSVLKLGILHVFIVTELNNISALMLWKIEDTTPLPNILDITVPRLFLPLYQSTMILRFGGAICPRKRARCVTVYRKSGGKSFNFNCEGLVDDNLYRWTSMCVLLSIQCTHVMCLSSSLDILSSKRLFVDLVKIPPHVSFTGSWEGDKEKVRTQ